MWPERHLVDGQPRVHEAQRVHDALVARVVVPQVDAAGQREVQRLADQRGRGRRGALGHEVRRHRPRQHHRADHVVGVVQLAVGHGQPEVADRATVAVQGIAGLVQQRVHLRGRHRGDLVRELHQHGEPAYPAAADLAAGQQAVGGPEGELQVRVVGGGRRLQGAAPDGDPVPADQRPFVEVRGDPRRRRLGDRHPRRDEPALGELRVAAQPEVLVVHRRVARDGLAARVELVAVTMSCTSGPASCGYSSRSPKIALMLDPSPHGPDTVPPLLLVRHRRGPPMRSRRRWPTSGTGFKADSVECSFIVRDYDKRNGPDRRCRHVEVASGIPSILFPHAVNDPVKSTSVAADSQGAVAPPERRGVAGPAADAVRGSR